jgi:probable rRNA maturation factor
MKGKHLSDTFSISSTVKSAPRIDGALFTAIKEKVVGKNYDLSLVFIGKTRAKRLNNTYRQKDYATDILSFPLDEESGEIFIYCPKARIKAKEFGRTFENYLVFIFIHGLFHLKGYDHGIIMENKEKSIRSLFNI